MIFPGTFFLFFEIFIFWAVRGVGVRGMCKRSKNNSKWKITISYVTSPGSFFIFLIFSFFRLLRGQKGKKWPKMTSKFCLLHFISQEPWIIWLSFVVDKFKMIMSPADFFIFLKFWYFGLWGGSKGKKWSRMAKNSVLCTLYLRNHISYDFHLQYTCLKGQYLHVFFTFFPKFNFWSQ